MSDTPTFDRRDFLKLVGIGVAGAAAGCGKPPVERLIPYLVAPTDILPGVPYWYASVCRECPAGCGILVKAREGRAIKIEGNPNHPMNRGALCSRGQASLQGLYDPDRIKTPLAKVNGSWKAISWDEALQKFSSGLGDAVKGKQGVMLLTGHVSGSSLALAEAWAKGAGGQHLAWEPFAYESLREANQRSFGKAEMPTLDFERAQMVLSFGADFLETFGNPVAQSRGFAKMRGRPQAGRFVAIEPRLSLTGANADEWIAVRPGGEMALALALVHVIAGESLGAGAYAEARDLVEAYSPEAVAAQTGVEPGRVTALAREFAKARPSLAVAGGIAAQSEQSVALHAAVNLLNWAAGNVGETVRFEGAMNLAGLRPFSDLQSLIDRMGKGELAVLVVDGANPVYATPAWAGFGPAMDKVPLKVSLSTVMDETTARCDLVLPGRHPLESWGDDEPARGVASIQQPAMQRLPMFDTRTAGDSLIAAAKAAGFGGGFPESWERWLKDQWKPRHASFGAGRDFDTFWNETVKSGGIWEDRRTVDTVRWSGAPAFAAPQLRGSGDLSLVLYPTGTLHDGRGANKPWLQEIPDPVTKAVWNSWVEIHPDTAKKLGIARGDKVKVDTESGSVETYAYVWPGVRRDVLAIPLGQGHTAYGRYAQGRGVNALALLPAAQDAASGAIAYLSAKARITKLATGGEFSDLVMVQREKTQGDREVAQLIPIAALLGGAIGNRAEAHDEGAAGNMMTNEMQRRPGANTEPRLRAPGESIPPHAISAFVPKETVRGPRQIPVHEGSYSNPNHHHRWAMAIDLNSCTGCSACVAACYAENNIPTVGPELIKRGREMAWIRIERYEEKVGYDETTGAGTTDVRHLPMMCQQCGDAPCETVCPVYATYHNPEGLNAQVYNRCVGTRYCSNNCPYKVRTFNWYDYGAPEKVTFSFPEPLNWQLNPDVTVRSKGVMEKCTFCIQRILEGKGNARDEHRPLRDGEIQTACAQSCPSQAIVFGDLLDPDSAVSRLSAGPRRYWALGDLNTKPGITYLKRIGREEQAG